MAQNLIINSDIVVKDAQVALYDEIVLAKLVWTGYEAEFTNGVKKGQTIRIKRPIYLKSFEFKEKGDLVIQKFNETTTDITIDTIFDTSFEIDTIDWTFKIEDFMVRYLRPAVKAVAQAIEDNLINRMYEGVQRAVEGLSGNPTNLQDLANIKKAAKKMKIPSGEAIAVVGLDAEAVMLGNIKELTKASDRADNGVHFDQAYIGHAMGVTYITSDKIDDIFGEIQESTYTDTATVKNEALQFDKRVVLTGGVSGQIIKKGQMLKAGTVTFKAAADATFASNGEVNVTVVELQSNIAAGVTVTTVDVGGNFLMHRNAVALVAFAPELMPGAVVSEKIIDEDTGLSFRLNIYYDYTAKSSIFSVDVLTEAKVIDPRLIAQF